MQMMSFDSECLTLCGVNLFVMGHHVVFQEGLCRLAGRARAKGCNSNGACGVNHVDTEEKPSSSRPLQPKEEQVSHLRLLLRGCPLTAELDLCPDDALPATNERASTININRTTIFSSN